MQLTKVELVRDEIIGFKPNYSDIGDVTELLMSDGLAEMDKRTLKSVRRAFAASYAVDLTAQRKGLRSRLGKGAGMLFHIDDRVFIPVKMRRAISENDATYGYVDVEYIAAVEETDRNRCRLRLINGLELQVYSMKSTLLGSAETGRELLRLLRQDSDKIDPREELVLGGVRVLIGYLQSTLEKLERIERKL